MKLKALFVAAIAALTFASCGEKINKNIEIVLPSKPSVTIPGIGGKESLELITEAKWKITVEEDSWITVTPLSGKGSGIITISANENTTGETRRQYIEINEQPFLVIQTTNAEIENHSIIGKWSTTAQDYIFTFNADKSCKAEMSRGTYEGTYTITGNIISISVTGMPAKINVTVNEIDNTTMKATVMGTELSLTKEEEK